MKHLADTEFVDLLDGSLAENRVAHVATCDRCRAKADAVRDALVEAGADDLAEPSPLFWEHFSARVGEAIRADVDADGALTWRKWRHHPALRWVAAACVLTTLGVAAAWRVASRGPADVTTTAGFDDLSTPGADAGITAATDTAAARPIADDVESDESWAVVRTAAEDIAWEDVRDAGVTARPGSAERVALELSAEERDALARLIETELRRSGA